MIRYSHSLEGVNADCLAGFFVGWPNPPSREMHLRMLEASDLYILAWDADRIVGYVSALSDGVLFSCITSLEVLPEWHGQGIGSELMRRAISALPVYATDLVCDPVVAPFYDLVGMVRVQGMAVRRRDLLQADT